MKNVKVAITGIGTVTSRGPDSAALLEGLLEAKPKFGPTVRHDVGFEITVGEAAREWFADHPFDEMDNLTGRLCLQAARECVRHAASHGAGPPDGLVLGTSTGGQSRNETALFAILDGRPPTDFSFRRSGCMAAPSRLVARDLAIEGPVQTISTACTSSANAIALGAAWIACGRCKRVLAGGGDALCYTTLSSFRILELTGPAVCRPFGKDRPGLTLGEGAGFLMLESPDEVAARGSVPLATMLGFGMSSDAHHMTAPPEDGAGAELAIRRALESAGLAPRDITYINAHGTGTKLNDAAEAIAIHRIFGDTPVMSCKGLIGHTLGGSGGIEAVASVLSLLHRRAFENTGAAVPSEDCPVSLIGPGGIRVEADAVVLSTSFAFGGNNCVLVFGGPERGIL